MTLPDWLAEWLTKDNRSGRTPEEEWSKQKLDQLLHGIWGFVTGIFPFVLVFFFGPWTWFGLVGSGGSITGWEIRERKQRRDGSHWKPDPWVDSIVFYTTLLIGVVAGAVLLNLPT